MYNDNNEGNLRNLVRTRICGKQFFGNLGSDLIRKLLHTWFGT